MKKPETPSAFSKDSPVNGFVEVINSDNRHYQILSTIDQMNMISSWTLFLCRERLNDGFQLSVRRNEILGEYEEHYDDDKEEYTVPDQIDGKNVVGVEDYFVVGGDLLLEEEYGESQFFRNLTDEEAVDFINSTPFPQSQISSET